MTVWSNELKTTLSLYVGSTRKRCYIGLAMPEMGIECEWGIGCKKFALMIGSLPKVTDLFP